MGLIMGISESEFGSRRSRLLQHLEQRSATGFVLFDASYIQYFTGFWFLATERPVAVAGTTAGDLMVFVPEFEVERVRAETGFDRVESYLEYPGTTHPMYLLQDVLASMGVARTIGVDTDGYPGILGYEGPALSEVSGAQMLSLGPFIEGLMRYKSEAEIALIRESGRWCAAAHHRLQAYSGPGTTEAEASLRAAYETTVKMLREVGSDYPQLASSDGASAGYRGQIGRRSSWAHAIAHNIEFLPGDVLVSETSAPMWGYNAELERTMIVGKPTDAMRRLFDHMVAARQRAFDAARPGVPCAHVDGAVMAYLEEQDLMPYWRQHTGHGIGLRNHEAPFLDLGDHTVLQSGMVFTIEPGLYDSAVGGFRHSDTVVVRDDGIEILTDYPTDIESLTIPG